MSRYTPIAARQQPLSTQAEPDEYYEFYDRRGRFQGRAPVPPGEVRQEAAWHEEVEEADPSYIGHYGGTHPEHRPWLSGELRRPAQDQARRTHSTTAQGTRRTTEQPGPPSHSPSATTSQRAPAHRATRALPDAPDARQTLRLPKARRLRFSLRWLLVGILLLLVMLTGWLLFNVVGSWWQGIQDGWAYGLPRTYQVDQYVGQQDSPASPDHFLALNLHGLIEIVQINPRHPEQDHIYTITSVSDEREPVTLRFADTTGDGRLDLLVSVGDSNPYTVVLHNTDKAFQPQQQH
jgi:hypothetical protein